MTIDDAISILEYGEPYSMEYSDALVIATDELKFRTQLEPEVETLNEIDRIYRCKKCHKAFFYYKQAYCGQCGQAVKWA